MTATIERYYRVCVIRSLMRPGAYPAWEVLITQWQTANGHGYAPELCGCGHHHQRITAAQECAARWRRRIVADGGEVVR